MSCICGKRACTCGSGNYETFDKTVPATQVTNVIPIGKGDDGDSAYEVAVSNGFVGTEGQWLASLIGAPGVDGLTVLSTVDNGDGTFTINYSDGSSFTSEDLTGPKGDTGNVFNIAFDIVGVDLIMYGSDESESNISFELIGGELIQTVE